ncbi:hypothetical protein [Microbacterium sp. NPDC087665]|uniref:hypothetical protein n=1 Tax=Microbacterium sp. NPDC087665 TaxID=3364194 RepID=UPI003809201C
MMEITLRLVWLLGLEDRATGLRSLFGVETDLMAKHPEHLADLGISLSPDEVLSTIRRRRRHPLP